MKYYLILITLLFTSCVNDITIDQYIEGCFDAHTKILGACQDIQDDKRKQSCELRIIEECVKMEMKDYE